MVISGMTAIIITDGVYLNSSIYSMLALIT